MPRSISPKLPILLLLAGFAVLITAGIGWRMAQFTGQTARDQADALGEKSVSRMDGIRPRPLGSRENLLHLQVAVDGTGWHIDREAANRISALCHEYGIEAVAG